MSDGRSFRPRKTLGRVGADIGSFFHGPHDDYRTDVAADPVVYPLALDRMLEANPQLFDPLDDAGVPLQQVSGQGLLYMPSRIAGYALAQWNLARRTGGADPMRRFLAAAEWFARQPQGRFMHEFQLEGMKTPWPSCLAQGEGLSVLARAYMATGERRFVTQARAALDLLEEPVSAGGVASALPDGSYFVEEYPGGRHIHVLNGALFAAVGLDDLARLPGDGEPRARVILDQLLTSLERNLDLWSTGDWSVYSVERSRFGARNACTLHYQLVHVVLLEHLFRASPERVIFARVLERWGRAPERATSRVRALAMKSFYRLTNGW
jgi:hypothetical protein